MTREKYSFNGFEEVEDVIRSLDASAAYLTLQDRSVRNVDEPLGRFVLDVTEARRFPVQPGEGGSGSSHADTDSSRNDDPDLDEGDDDDDADEQGSGLKKDLYSHDAPLESSILSAALRWIRLVAVRNVFGEKTRTFRVKVHSAKGIRILHSLTFVCVNHGFDSDVAPGKKAVVLDVRGGPVTRTEQPPEMLALQQAVSSSFESLAGNWTRFGQTCLDTLRDIKEVHGVTVDQLSGQLKDARHQLDRAFAALIQQTLNDADAKVQQQTDQEETAFRTAVAHDAITQGGAILRLLLGGGKGIDLPPALEELARNLMTSPDLMATLADPRVQALLRDKEHLASLASVLRDLASRAVPGDGASTPPPPGGPEHPPAV